MEVIAIAKKARRANASELRSFHSNPRRIPQQEEEGRSDHMAKTTTEAAKTAEDTIDLTADTVEETATVTKANAKDTQNIRPEGDPDTSNSHVAAWVANEISLSECIRRLGADGLPVKEIYKLVKRPYRQVFVTLNSPKYKAAAKARKVAAAQATATQAKTNPNQTPTKVENQ